MAKSYQVRPSRVRQIAGLPTGEVYSPKAVDKAAARLPDMMALAGAHGIGCEARWR